MLSPDGPEEAVCHVFSGPKFRVQVRPDSTSLRIAMICDSVNLLFLMLSSFLDPEDSLFQWLNFRGLDQGRPPRANVA